MTLVFYADFPFRIRDLKDRNESEKKKAIQDDALNVWKNKAVKVINMHYTLHSYALL
jgi:hypothetical protein